MFKRILILCTGNICRSPITEVLLRQVLNGSDIAVSSAGTAAMVGHPAHPYSIEVMESHGMDLHEHRARQVTREMLRHSDLILIHDDSHMSWINSFYPEYRGRTYKLGYWRNNADIADPMNKPKAMFEAAYGEIVADIGSWQSRLKAG